MIKRITATVILLVIAAIPGVTAADSALDFEIAKGHFFSQGNGLDSPNDQKGYRLTDEDDVLFYSEFRRLGGVPVLGYPISQRFNWQGHITQLTQRAVLQWDDAEGQVVVFGIFDYLSAQGWDDWLREHKAIPKQLPSPGAVDSLDPSGLVNLRMTLLDQDPRIKSFYLAAEDPLALYGLPTSNAEDFGPFVVVRFQRAVLQHWKVDSSVAASGDVTVVNAGDIAKELGVFPASAMAPEDAPVPEPQRMTGSSRGSTAVARGLATWYGADFHGLEMRNGEIYDMYDPTTTASNIYPLESKVRVISLATGKSVVVRVTDTGAFRYPIIVDLSWAAFRKIADPNEGVIEVTVEPLRDR